MRKARNKKFCLLMSIVFAFTMMFPFSAFAATEDNTSITSTYKYVSADNEVPAGVVRVVYDDMDAATDTVIVQLTLPDGVEYTDKPASMAWVTKTNGYTTGTKVDSASNYFEAKFTGLTIANFDVEFNYGYDQGTIGTYDSGDVAIDIADDFTGNLDVAVEVIGMDGGDIIWTDSDDVTIAKVSEGEVDAYAGSMKTVSTGGGKEVAKITLEESKAAAFSLNEIVTLEIETEGVEFDSVSPSASYMTLTTSGSVDSDGDGSISDDEKLGLQNNDDGDCVFYRVAVTTQSTSLPGKIKFETPKVDIAPDVTGDIEISVTSNDDADVDETLTVATVGDVTAEITDIEDADGVVYAGQDEDLDVEFKVATTDESDFNDNAGDIISFKLNNGEFTTEPEVDGSATNVKLYDDDEAFYYTIQGTDDEELTISGISILLDNDAEAGDLTLTVDGDYGELGEVVIAQVAKPFTATSDKTEIIAESLGQAAGDIILTETDDDAFIDNQYLYFEMPSGVELKGKPSIEVTEGSADAKIADFDDDFFVVQITEPSGSTPSVLRIYNIKYDTGKLALTGDVTVDIYGDIDENIPNETPAKSKVDTTDWDFDDDSLITSVTNATVVDLAAVTATFAVGDEGVAIKNGRTLVQVNMLCDTLDLQKSWDAASKTAYFVKEGKVVAFTMGENAIYINGTKLPMDQGGVIINGATYATLRGIQAAFGGELTWDDTTKTATFDF